MAADERDRTLRELLHVDGSELDLSPLDEASLTRLEELVARSLRAEEERVDQALRATLRFLPPLLRKRAGKILFPEGRQ